MSQIDYRKELSAWYTPSARQPGLIDLPPLNFLMIDGDGKPDKPEFQEAAGTVYPVAYTLKFMVRKSHGLDFKVMPMEVRWFVNREQKEFKWTMMIMQPEVITPELYTEAVAAVKAKDGAPLLDRLRFENFAEGRCAQMLHKGPYPEMENTLEIMLKFVQEQGCTTDRRTHDIYLNSILKARPENLKTVMRMQVTPA